MVQGWLEAKLGLGLILMGNKTAHSEDQIPCPGHASLAVCLGWRWEL